MKARTYQDCYRTLRARSDCSWKELRLAYRRRVRTCHPDLQPLHEQAGRDDEFKQVALAYRLIARYRRRHGVLPPPSARIDERHSVFHAAYAKPADEHAFASAEETNTSRWRPPRIHVAVFAAFVSGVGTAAIIETLDEQSTPRIEATTQGELAVGMDTESVVEIQGIPNHTNGSVWYYGDSGVIFDKGCVVGWENISPFPLRTVTSMAYLPGAAIEQASAANSERKAEDCVLPDS